MSRGRPTGVELMGNDDFDTPTVPTTSWQDIRTIAGWELRGAIRSRWVLGTAIAFAAAAVLVSLLGLRSLRDLGLSGVGPGSAGLLNLAVLFPPLIGLLLGANSIVNSRERGVLAMIAAQPVSRFAYAAGVFLGLSAAVWTTLLIGFSLAAVIVAGPAQVRDLGALLSIAGASLLVATVAVALGMAISALSASRTQAASAATAVWFVLALGMDLALAGVASSIRLGPGALMAIILLNPVEAARVLALLAASPDGGTLGPFGAYLVNTYSAGGAAAILISALAAWAIGPVLVAWWVVSHRDI